MGTVDLGDQLMARFGFERPQTGKIDFSDYVYEYPSWQRRLVGLVRSVLAKRTYENMEETGHDPQDDEEVWEELLLLAFPYDGYDNRKKV
jgi:hypothetical protein